MAETTEVCFACERATATTIARRAKCVARGKHRPKGEVITHHDQPTRRCTDCNTLVRI